MRMRKPIVKRNSVQFAAICDALDCQPGDILAFEGEKNPSLIMLKRRP